MPTDVRCHGGVAGRFHRDERGAALLVALMAILLTMALGTALILSAGIESKITRNFRARAEAFYAADAALEHTLDEVRAIGDWNAILSGLLPSAFADGPPNGIRVLADGHPLDLGEVVNLANCRQTAPCSSAAMDAPTAERPWGANNPRWTLFAWGFLTDLLQGTGSPFYVVTMVGDDSSENDGDPLLDGSTPCTRVRLSRAIPERAGSNCVPKRSGLSARTKSSRRRSPGATRAAARRITMTASIRQARASCPGAK